MFNFLKNISSTELIVLIVILVLLFGAKAAVGIGKTSGETVRELKRVKNEFTKALEGNDDNKSSKN